VEGCPDCFFYYASSLPGTVEDEVEVGYAVISGPVPPGINCIERQIKGKIENQLPSTLYLQTIAPQCNATSPRNEMTRTGKRRLTIAIELPFKSVFPSGVATVPVDVT
jgi:hypothetical protein